MVVVYPCRDSDSFHPDSTSLGAGSPQAKGRVERNHGTHQDRLIKKLRRKKISSYEAANQYLEGEYLPEHNRRFSSVAAKPEDYHGRKLTARELREVFRLETERAISNDWVVRHEGHFLQLQPKQRRYGPTKRKALICEWEDGSIELYYRGERIAFRELKELPQKAPTSVAPVARAIVVRKAKKDHPWRRGFGNMKPWMPSPTNPAPHLGMHPYASPQLQGFASGHMPGKNTT